MEAIWREPARVTREDEAIRGPNAPSESFVRDLEIVEQARLDPAAFAPLYERYFPAVHAYCLRRVTDRERAADATSEIFTRAIAALPRFRPQPSRPDAGIRSWLFTIAHNVVIDHHRRFRPSQPLDQRSPGEVTPPQLIDGRPLPEEHAIAADERQRLRVVLSRLTESQRQVTELRLAGLTGAEIGAVLGLTTGAVKALQFRAYSRLRELLGDERESGINDDGDA